MRIRILHAVLTIVFVFSIAPVAPSQMQGDNYRVQSSVLSGGGRLVTSQNYQATGSLGQSSPAGTSSSSSYTDYAGFWQPIIAAIAKGDINGDGVIDLTDAVLALQALTGIDATTIIRRADVNSDGKISISEVLYVLHDCVGLREQPE